MERSGLDRRLADAVERVGHGLRALSQRTAREHGLTPLQQQVVLALTAQPEVRREVSALAAEFDVTKATTSDAVSALERKGLITRTPGQDGRRRLLALTDDGAEVARALEPWDEPLLRVLRDVPEADRATTLHTLLRVIAGLQRSGVVSVARTCVSCRFFRPDVRPDPVAPHHCGLLDAPLPLAELRVDCLEHEPATT
ncbi:MULTISPECIES: MarR family winged helix-turn-helix transcriptional regulator [Actinosynnema]|uniref:MarR family transcriptional regulator n=1 Tax=Actinosynnema pretiosum TaxID=42197 RepID=A0A290Z9J2_9PSEU|nr:MarR family winged helix-turn-helix transcriptional regulator [Actinosynnema pretiosum]ATE55655.1 MarR family transcriptional regulator [Actinosynnema pretiosum]